MTALLEDVRRKIVDEKCLVKGGLKKDGCKVVMTGVPNFRLIVDFDKPDAPLAANATRCDYLVIAEGKGKGKTEGEGKGNDGCGWVAVLELKRGRLDSTQVVRQLQAGASAAERLVPGDVKVRFRPVAVCGGTMRKYELEALKHKANRVAFHEHKKYVRVMKCGAPLVDVLFDKRTA